MNAVAPAGQDQQIAVGAGPSMPPLRRGSMVAQPWLGFWRGLIAGLVAALITGLGRALSGEHAPRAAVWAGRQPWERAAQRRRRRLLALVAGSAGAAALLAHTALPATLPPALRALELGLFALLFAWVAAGFFTALMGAWVLWRGDAHALSARSVRGDRRPLDAGARTAIVMPICNEQVGTVFAGLRATCESLAATGDASLFDVYVLSDSSDPSIRAAELAAWAELRATFGPGWRIHYRWRTLRRKRKAGNVADFCRRWGRAYRYMVVLDADSVMSGQALVTLLRLMERHPEVGILQSAPLACGLDTLHARAQQFAQRVVGRLYTAGMQYWQLGESHYWGHNAILRVAPFMQHCALAPLPGRGGLAGEILSHDFVEAALMRRAGWQVWLVQDLPGSWEQQPPNLLDELQRDRRWCQGNLQNLRLVAEPGLHPVHRAMLLTGAMAYLSAPLWLGFVLLGSWLWLQSGAGGLGLGGASPQGLLLWLATLAMLVLPRVLGVAALIATGRAEAHGGPRRLAASAALEALLSLLQAPLRMLAHSLFVLAALTGLKLDWKSPPREASAVPWSDALQRFAAAGGAAAAALTLLAGQDPRAALWLLPLAGPLLLAVPFTVWTSRRLPGRWLRRRGGLLLPEERRPPAELQRAWQLARQARPAPCWRDVLHDPWLFDVVRAAMGRRDTAWGSRGQARHRLLRGLADADAEHLGARDRLRLLSEPQQITRLRDQVAAAAG